jgi:hypothetical protein
MNTGETIDPINLTDEEGREMFKNVTTVQHLFGASMIGLALVGLAIAGVAGRANGAVSEGVEIEDTRHTEEVGEN